MLGKFRSNGVNIELSPKLVTEIRSFRMFNVVGDDLREIETAAKEKATRIQAEVSKEVAAAIEAHDAEVSAHIASFVPPAGKQSIFRGEDGLLYATVRTEDGGLETLKWAGLNNQRSDYLIEELSRLPKGELPEDIAKLLGIKYGEAVDAKFETREVPKTRLARLQAVAEDGEALASQARVEGIDLEVAKYYLARPEEAR